MIRVGLTGGIGSGKSYVAALMNRVLGTPVYDTDWHAKQLTAADPAICSALTQLVGPELYKGGVFDRQMLAAFIFGHPKNMERVNAIIHPAVRKDFQLWAQSQKNCDICVLESAILFESGFNTEVDFTVAVQAPLELRIERCLERDKSDRESVLKRISSQMDQDEKCRLADFVIVNDGAGQLEPQLEALIDKCKETYNSKH